MQGMIAHHAQAIHMTRMAESAGASARVLKLAQKIDLSQAGEIALMQNWLLDNGQFALQPNNRCQFFDPAFNPQEMKKPDFKVATRKYSVEQHAKWRLGDTTTVTYDDHGETAR
jgi:hypothetical protein